MRLLSSLFGRDYGPEYDRLNRQQKAAVRQTVQKHQACGGPAKTDGHDGGEAYAYGTGGRCHWGYNSGTTGHCIARGVINL